MHHYFVFCVIVLICGQNVYAVDIPKFYVDSNILAIVNRRVSCLRGGNAITELGYLQQESASEFFRSHELYAHNFFVESLNNPHRVSKLVDAEFEYIPLLPLNWRVETSPSCSYASLMQDILKIQSYVEERDKKVPASQIKPKFSVASTFNMRTAFGTGMPTQIRRGEIYNNVTNFVISLSVGHYERYPQCPDLLRKSWKYVVEVPYVPMHTKVVNGKTPVSSSMDSSQLHRERKYMFHFSGNFALYGCEMVCSVRNAVIDINTRADTLIINTTISDSNTGVRKALQQGIEQSTFCIVTKADSYSTSFFYHALAAGCIPIVISDWFTFSYPWIVPYELFTLRVAEIDFLKNPNHVLDHIISTIGNNPKLLSMMRENMNKFKGLLSFDGITYQSDQYKELMSNDLYSSSVSTKSASNSGVFQTYLPMELLLLELRYAQVEYKYYNGLPCYRPHMCHHDRLNGSLATNHIFYARKGGKSGIYEYSPVNYFHGTSASPSPVSKGSLLVPAISGASYSLVDGGMQVNYLNFPEIEDIRSHMCKHAGRLIGHYKIVFFMQCVRILWPLQPGQFKPVDNANRFDPAKRPPGKVADNGISEFDYGYVRSFHNISRPSDWYLTNYPVTSDTKRIYSIRQAEQMMSK